MISSFALVLLGTLAATPCENLKSVSLSDTTITAAEFVPEGPAPQRGGGGGAARGGAARGGAPAQPPAPEGTVYYYESVLDKMGKNQSSWMRLFMAPGMAHCGGGPGVNTFDSIGTIENWREQGIAPDQMMGSNAQSGLTRPICPYPQYAQYKGTGDLKDAANWVCKTP